MQLPSRLRSTTLGDMLGALHRAAASGTLELVEDRGRTHRVHLRSGLVAAVEIDGAGASLAEVLRREAALDDDVLRRSLLRAMASRRLHGEVLIRDFKIAPAVVGRALRAQLVTRLAALDKIPDARIHFSVVARAPRGALADAPLAPTEFLAGRRRARDRGPAAERPRPHGRPTPISADPRAVALRVLGVAPDADSAVIKRAFRSLARSYHPDLHPNATDDERHELEARFAEVAAAYRAVAS